MCNVPHQLGLGKKFLAISSGIVLGLSAQTSPGQEPVTTSWTGGAGQNVWTRNGNWSINQPNTGSIALITSSSGSTLFLRESGSPGTVDCGTLVMQGGFLNVFAGASEATINFGTSAGIDVSTIDPEENKLLGDVSGSTPKVNFDLPTNGLLTVRVESGVRINAKIVGAGGVSLQRLGSTGDVTVGIGSVSLNRFTGGATVGSHVTAQILHSTIGGAEPSGPLGTGTVTLAGGGLSFGDAAAATFTFANAIRLTDHSAIEAPITGSNVILPGTISLSSASGSIQTGHVLTLSSVGSVLFNNSVFSSTDSGTFSIVTTAEGNTSFDVDYHVSSGTSVFGGAVGKVLSYDEGLPRPDGSVIKTGAGLFAVKHFRTHVMNIDEGVLRVTQSSSNNGTPDFVGSTEGTSLVRRLKLDGVSNPGAATFECTPTVKLDLQNNDLIVDWKDKFPNVSENDLDGPLGTLTNGTLGVGSAGYRGALRAAYLGNGSGLWTGNGITSSLAQAGTTTFAIGYANSVELLGLPSTFSSSATASFSGQYVTNRAALFKFTYGGDATLDGKVDLDDYTELAAYFGVGSRWMQGDSNYDGVVNLDDFTILAINFGAGGTNALRGGSDALPPLAELYVAMLDDPEIYWGAKSREDIWWRFAEFESMNLGTIPPMPESMRSSIPEPAFGAFALLALAGSMNRFRRRQRPAATR